MPDRSQTESRKPSLFISYSREDSKYASALYKHLHAFRFQYDGDVFMDRSEIRPGDPWPAKLQQALQSARAFAVLISKDFFGSDFCLKEELPAIIAQYQKRNAEIFLIFVSPYNWAEYTIHGLKLGDIQAAGPFDENGREQWLTELDPKHDAALTAIVKKIHQHFALGTPPLPSRAEAAEEKETGAGESAGEPAFEESGSKKPAASRSPIIIAIEEAEDRIPEAQLLRAERHMTVALDPDQVVELEEIGAKLSGDISIDAITACGMDAWSILRSAQSNLEMLFESAKESEYPQPIAWTGKAPLLIRIHRAILIACIADNNDPAGFVSVGYGSHYFHPLHESGSPRSMQKRQNQTENASIRIKTLKVADGGESAEDMLPEAAGATSAEVVLVSASDLTSPLLSLLDLIKTRTHSATRLVIGLGGGQLTADSLLKLQSRLPAVSIGGLHLSRDNLVRAIRRLLPAALRVQAVPVVISSIRNQVVKHGHKNKDATLFKDALCWTTWSWVGRPLFSVQFGEVISAAYPHLMALRSIASREWYFDREEGIPPVYKAKNLIESGDAPGKQFHLYLSGAGGTGKSCFLRYVYDTLSINQRDVLPVWYKVDAPSSEWETVETRIKEEVAKAIEHRLGKKAADELTDDSKDLGYFLTELVSNLRQRKCGIEKVIVFIDQLERTFESGENPELHRLDKISKKFIALLDQVGVGQGIRIFIASRKQYLPDFLSSFQKAFDNHLHFNVLQTIANDNEQVEFIQKVLRWCQARDLVGALKLDEEASKELAGDGHPLNMMLSMIHVFSQGRTGRMSKKDVEALTPREKRFYLDEQLAAKDEIDWYFLLAMAHARTEIVRFEEVWWRLRLVTPSLTQRVNDLGRQGVLERLWLLGHLGRTIYARPVDDDPARFLEFFHANLRDHLITTVMNYGGEKVGLAGRKGTPPVWRALDRLTAAAKDWKQSQQLMLRDDVIVLMEQKDVFVEPVNKEERPEKVESFYLLFLRDSMELRDDLFEAAKECFVYSALVHDVLGRWAFKHLFRNVADQVKRCRRWLERCDRESRIRIFQYLIELRDVKADSDLSELIFDTEQTALSDAWEQLADILSEPLYAARYRRTFVVSLLEYLLSKNVAFPADNSWTKRFGEFCVTSCHGDRDELLSLIEAVAESVVKLQSEQLQRAVTSLLEDQGHIETWLQSTAVSGIDLSAASRDIHDYVPPRIELRAGAELRAAITDAALLQWHREISNLLGLPVPLFTPSRGEIAASSNDPRLEMEQHLDTPAATEYQLELLIEGRLYALGDFYPGSYQTLQRHWEIAAQEPPAGSRRTQNEALQECVIWLDKDYLDRIGWIKQSWSWDQAVLNWLHLSLRKHIEIVFPYYDVMPFINKLWSAPDARLNQRDFLRTIAGNFQGLWRVLVNLAREFVPLNERAADLMLELQQVVRQTGQTSTAYLTQKLREHVRLELCRMFTDKTNQLPVLLVDAALEQELIDKLRISDGRHTLALNLDQGLKLAAAVRGTFETVVRTEDMAPVLVCDDSIRLPLFRMIQHFDSRIHVLSYTELSAEVLPRSKGIVSGVSLNGDL